METKEKEKFKKSLSSYLAILKTHMEDSSGCWNIRGFIDIVKNIYSLSNDTKVISKIIELNIFPGMLQYANKYGYEIVLPAHQNYYPDITLISKENNKVKFALDLKTTFRVSNTTCNGFTLGSHGNYFINRQSLKNIQYPYASYLGHYCLGIIYDRNKIGVDETRLYSLKELDSVPAVASNFVFFIAEKWKIASDKSGSGNTANIGSIKNIDDLLNENGIFAKYNEQLFDEYWINYGKISYTDSNGNIRKVSNLNQFLEFKNKRN